MSILYCFKFVGGYLFEIKYEEEKEKSKRYKWFVRNNDKLEQLIFVKMEGEVRTFEGDHIVDLEKEILIFNGYLFPLTPCDPKDA